MLMAAWRDMDAKIMIDMPLVPRVELLEVGLGPSDKGNAASTPKTKKKSMTSLYLKFFETAPDGKSRLCKFCKQSYSIATATGNLGRHLNHRHPGYDRVNDATQQPPEDSVSHIKPPSQVKLENIDFDCLNWLLLKWSIKSSIPPPIFEENGIINCLKFLNSSVTLWSAEKVHAVTLEIFRSMQQDVKASLEHINSKVSITLNFWTSHEQLFYMSINCHWIDESWSLRRVLLEVRHIPYPCTGSEIFHLLVDVLRMYNLEKKVLSCTSDNSQLAIAACHALKEEMDARKVPFYYLPCAAHTLNQIIEDGLRSPKPILSKIREFALELNSVPEIAQDFMQLATIYQEGPWNFPLDTSATWNGGYTLLDIVLKAPNSMDNTIKKHEETFGSRNLLLNNTEKSVISILHSYLEPFHKITTNLSTCKFPTVGLVLFFMDHVFELIGNCREACRHDWLNNIAEEMAKRARVFTSQGYNLFTYIAAVLDPRIKKDLIPENLNLDKNLEEARNHFTRYYASSHSPEEANMLSFAEEIARKRRRVSTKTANDELSQYLSEPPAPIAADVLEWWKLNSSRYPRLSAMARDYLAVQGTSVDPEDLFSNKGDRMKKKQFSLPYASMKAIMCIDSWSHCGFKFKFRSAEINYEKLVDDTYFDSGNSKC